MKKIYIGIVLMLIFSSISFAVTPTRYPNGVTTMTPAQESTNSITPAAGELGVQGGVIFIDGINEELILVDPATASNTAFKNTLISTQTLVNAATTFTLAYAGFTDIIHPRNITASYATGSTTGTVLTAALGSLVITGIDAKGNAATETLAVSTQPALGTGNIAWRTITSAVLTTTSIDKSDDDVNTNTIYVRIGSGVKMGIPADIQAAGDVYKVIEAGSLTTTTYTLSTTYDTISFATAPNGTNDYTVLYKFIRR